MQLIKLTCAVFLFLAPLTVLNSFSKSSISSPAIIVGNQKQLFVDYRFIESSEGITLSMHEPYETGEKLLVIDQPWEQGCVISGSSSVLKEDGRNGPAVRLWYDLYDIATGGTPGKGFRALAYAESSDGIHFRKPILGLVERDGSSQNNLVMPTDTSQTAVGGGSVFRDANPNCPPDQRYKSWSKFYSTPGTLKGENRIWYSADGLHWKLYETVPTGLRKADTQPTWFWDSRIGRYIGYSREWVDISATQTIRMVGYNESDDMLHWDNFSLALQPDELDGNPYGVRRVLASQDMQKGAQYATEDVSPTAGTMDIYGPGIFKYGEAQDVYISLFAAFHHFTRRGGESWPDTTDLQLAVSRDGRNFVRMGGRHPFLRLGPSGSFYSKWLWPVLQPIRMNDELWIYYWGTNRDHSSRLDPAAKEIESGIGRAVIRLDGFVSADTSYSGGSLTTPPIIFDGTRLELNLDTSAGGEALVEIRDASGKPLAGYTLAEADALNGNNVRVPVTWQGKADVSSLAGKAVKLYFKLRDCRLYSFQFK
jgi:hypothetical protein